MKDKQPKIKIKFSRRKTIGLYANTNGIELRAPHGTSESYINDFIREKRSWISNQLENFKIKSEQIYRLVHGETLPILGLNKQLYIQQSVSSQAIETHDSLILEVTRLDARRIEKVFSDFLKAKANEIIPTLVEEYATKINQKHNVTAIKFRRTKTKWGHCTHDGKLQFNWLIMMAPMKIVRSLVAHEVCHLKHLNHSTEFWQLVSSIDPDHQLSKHWLNTHGFKLSLFEQ